MGIDTQVAGHAIAARFAPTIAPRLGSNVFPSGGPVASAFQQMDDSLVTETSVSIVACFHRNAMADYLAQLFNTVLVRLVSIDGTPTTYDAPLQNLVSGGVVQFHTVTGLPASTRFEVQLWAARFGNGGYQSLLRINSTDDPVVAYTRIAAPTATALATGTVSPKVAITVTPPGGLTGFDTQIANAGRSFVALYSSVASGATTYESTAGTDGRPDRYFVRARNTAWPTNLQYSPPVTLDIADPQP
jgi:hypothetical protein